MTSVTVLGREVALPVEVRQASAAMATFLVDADAVRRLIEPSGLRPTRLPLGRALCIIATVLYVDNDLGAYNEVAVAFPVSAGEHGPAGAYIHQLPVNETFTLAAGRDIWGFPKWLADIDLTIGRRGRCELSVEGERILSLDVRPRPIPLPSRPTTMSAYADADGTLRRTPFWTHARGTRAGPGGARLDLGHTHPMARELRALGLPKRPLMSSIVSTMQSRFDAPIEVEPRA